MITVKQLVIRLLPNRIQLLYERLKFRLKILRMQRRNRRLPIKEVFTRIYRDGEWGPAQHGFCSGGGSTDAHAVSYGNAIANFIRDRNISSVLDLGCGDFAIGRRIQMEGVRYIGVDIVDALVSRNQETCGGPNTEFRCLDIITDELPNAQLCLIRQVLQHLSNAQIMAIVKKLTMYKYFIVTEHYPALSVKYVPNRDKPHGGDTRIIKDSAVYLDLPPFSMSGLEKILEVPAGVNLRHEGETIVSYLGSNASIEP